MGQKGCRFSLFLFSPVQANLALSPTALLPSPKSPEAKLQPTPLSPSTPESPLTPLSPHSPSLRPPLQSSEEEDPVSFQRAPEGTTLPSFNKTRARLSFKRRPPTRQHRRSTGEETLSPLSPGPDHNGLTEPAFNTPNDEAPVSSPTQEEAPGNTTTEDAPVNTPTVEERDNTDCDAIEEEVSQNNPEDTAVGSEEQPGAEEQGPTQEDLEQLPPSELCPAESEHTETEAAPDTDVNCEQ